MGQGENTQVHPSPHPLVGWGGGSTALGLSATAVRQVLIGPPHCVGLWSRQVCPHISFPTPSLAETMNGGWRREGVQGAGSIPPLTKTKTPLYLGQGNLILHDSSKIFFPIFPTGLRRISLTKVLFSEFSSNHFLIYNCISLSIVEIGRKMLISSSHSTDDGNKAQRVCTAARRYSANRYSVRRAKEIGRRR